MPSRFGGCRPHPLLPLLLCLAGLPARAAASIEEEVEQTAKRIERVGVSFDYFGEASRMSGEQWINNFRSDESFDYHAGPAASTLYVLLHPTERIRFGPLLRFLGDYGERFTFGYLGEVALYGEVSMRAFEQVDIAISARAGASLLFPGQNFSSEIRRLQSQNADVWNVPRVGWVGGLGVGARRKLAGNFYARLDLSGALGHQFLFLTDQIVDGLRFRKYWGNDIRRLQVSIGFEVTL
jgi:hypothetical protein